MTRREVITNAIAKQLQQAGVMEKEPRAASIGFSANAGRWWALVHLDASTHEWISSLPLQHLTVALTRTFRDLVFEPVVDERSSRSSDCLITAEPGTTVAVKGGVRILSQAERARLIKRLWRRGDE